MPYPRKVPRKPPDGHVSADEAMKILDMAPATFYRYKRESSDFPEAVKLWGKAWYRVTDLDEWKKKNMG